METEQKDAEKIVKDFLSKLNASQSHVIPIDHLLRKLNWNGGEENQLRLKQIISSNCPPKVRVNLI